MNNIGIETAVMRLIQQERFYAELLLKMQRFYVNSDKCQTIGVNVTNTINLYINLDFWNTLTLEQQIATLKHECLHIFHNHLERGRHLGIKETDNIIYNQAADYAINEFLPDLPDTIKILNENGEIILDEMGKPKEVQLCKVPFLQQQLNKKIERRQSTEYYYSLLKEENKKNEQGKIQMPAITLDDHSIWEKGNQDSEYTKEIIRNVVNDVIKTCGGEACNIPFELSHIIDKLRYSGKDWKQEIQRFAANCAEIKIEETRKKRNRRYGLMYPGLKYYPKLHLAVAIDSSGSISNRELEQFITEIHNLYKLEVKITVLVCDVNIQQIFSFNPHDKIIIKGRGGTAFKPVFDTLQSKDFIKKWGNIDGLIYFTDGENWDKNEVNEPKAFKVLWTLLPGKTRPYNWGFHTELRVEK